MIISYGKVASHQFNMPSLKSHNELAPELRTLVKRSVALLGNVIREELGLKAYGRIESLRKQMTVVRGSSHEVAYAVLKRSLEDLRKLSMHQREEIAQAFTLMLELMNACESSYRTWRLRSGLAVHLVKRPDAIIYVLTAHPTEARSPETIALFREIQNALTEWIDDPKSFEIEKRILSLLRVAWRLSPSRRRKPTVRDEADAIYSMVLQSDTLGAILRANREIAPVFLRTWVGGDKDGHPGVDEVQLHQSLQASRTVLLQRFESGASRLFKLAERMGDPQLMGELKPVRQALKGLRELKRGDGRRVGRLRTVLKGVTDFHPLAAELRLLLKVFPGLVVPLELRESSDLLCQAAEGKPLAISRMMVKVRVLSEGGDPKWYARGLIISMASNMDHVRAAAAVVKKQWGSIRLPIIPLFEQNVALESAPQIAGQMLADRELRAAVHEYWGGYFEIMVGYSDSAKETGVLKSRLEIAAAIHSLDRVYRKAQKTGTFKPVFFHGSGGSTDRGGGSIEEQTAWWPDSALRIYKATIQGETIERSTASPEITRRRLDQIAQRVGAGGASAYQASAVLRRFADATSIYYRVMIGNPEFLKVVSCATIYRYLSDLKMGSRPSKRGQVLSVGALRAIPWVMCWTQTRALFPTWWGAGSAWRSMSARDQKELRKQYGLDPLFCSYVKVLASTLAKVELPIWQLYLENSGLDAELTRKTISDFRREFRLAVTFVRAITGERDLLGFRPWLGTSIRLRAPMIHPLNLIQVLLLRDPDPALLRLTVTGISSGMMTTG
ncbi:phosphoenolpyruvate carboxylase [Bdellovibrionota bacterium FG-1]